ncbi:phage tail sheath family protein [Aequorivita marina]|uniref:phage tail sheath family protein n=1 Tax=Aequorivita marina TaxID=3073654 RepID=UPI00287400D1|nr:phage tail sheath subtilisin-like domain-containing protein [Aequorivita sp. S2608]MDS1299033.1 phage tail sheath subtilisin-like domain-containing protein [Aequorivita sp. S2608]
MKKRFVFSFILLFIFTFSGFSQVKGKTIKKSAKKERILLKRKKATTVKNNNKAKVSVQENRSEPPSINQVATAIPAFIGYTEKGPTEPTQISSMADYKSKFGGPSNDDIETFIVESDGTITYPSLSASPKYKMYYMLKLYFANGGGDCFITSVGSYNNDAYSIKNNEMLAGLSRLNNEDLPTLILFPDAISSKNRNQPTALYKAALAQCAERRDRFLICDVEEVDTNIEKSAENFRFAMGTQNLQFGAAYFPTLATSLNYTFSEDKIKVKLGNKDLVLRHTDKTILNEAAKNEQSLYHIDNGRYRKQYQEIKNFINAKNLELPPSAAVAGIYATVDASRGVWKAPANISLNKVSAPKINIDRNTQAGLNVHSSGKSINAIRSFSGKGVLVWGARTLAGNNNEWKYISVKRLGISIEESVNNALERFKYEPNNARTWTLAKAMTENYLNGLWRAGALSGAKPEDAFFVSVGLGKTMTPQDVQEGKMIMIIGIAASRPAEFNILNFSQKMN